MFSKDEDVVICSRGEHNSLLLLGQQSTRPSQIDEDWNDGEDLEKREMISTGALKCVFR